MNFEVRVIKDNAIVHFLKINKLIKAYTGVRPNAEVLVKTQILISVTTL